MTKRSLQDFEQDTYAVHLSGGWRPRRGTVCEELPFLINFRYPEDI